MFKDEILENKRRRKIYSTLKKTPGMHIRELERILGIPLASLQHHLNYMTQRGIIVEEKSAHYTRYYSSPLEAEDKKVLSVLRQKRLREIVMIILLNKKAKYSLIVESTNLPTSTASFYLRHLLDNNIIERTKIGYQNIYTLKNEKKIEKILIIYRSSIIDKAVDKWTDTWLENRRPNSEKKST
jgi:predicted transcriptional regulator